MNDMMLIVDDVEMNREILKVIFGQKYEILEAESGEEALSMIETCRGSIDVVLLDLMMNGLNGFDVLEKRQEMDFFQKIPVVVITGSNHMEDQVHAFDLGANEYISKPFITEIVASRVNNVMASNSRMHSVELEVQRMKLKSELDEMTGLYNKTTTEYTMDSVLKLSDKHTEVLMVIDIDNFKTVNDTKGHQSGDHVIKIIANLISGLFRKTDVIGRIGGDEFCVLMVDIPDMEIAYAKVNELIQTMRYKPNLTIPEYVTLSIGMATNHQKSTSYVELFKKADEALYKAKQSGKAQYREYGVEPISVEEDERPIAILLSNSRNVCSTIHALIPNYVRIVEALDTADLEKISPEDRERAWVMYVDVSDFKEDTTQFWEQMTSLDWMKKENMFAICEEGNVSQYLCALKSGVADMFTTPIDHETFKRRTIKKLEELGIKEVGKNNAATPGK